MPHFDWDSVRTSAPGPQTKPHSVPCGKSYVLFLGPVLRMTLHWMESMEQSLPHLATECPRCNHDGTPQDGMAFRKGGYAPARLYTQKNQRGVLCAVWLPQQCVELLPTDRPLRGLLFEMNRKAGKRSLVIPRFHEVVAEPLDECFDVRPILENTWRGADSDEAAPAPAPAPFSTNGHTANGHAPAAPVPPMSAAGKAALGEALGASLFGAPDLPPDPNRPRPLMPSIKEMLQKREQRNGHIPTPLAPPAPTAEELARVQAWQEHLARQSAAAPPLPETPAAGEEGGDPDVISFRPRDVPAGQPDVKQPRRTEGGAS